MAADNERAMGPAVQNSLSSSVSLNPSEQPSTTNYTIPGILHFIKHEWSRFEKERANWEVERAELQAKIAFLQGERKGHENLMHDLVRRIKMLEYALKQERAKLYKLQHGKDMGFELKPPNLEPENTPNVRDLSAFSAQREESRKILRDYLREVGFPDNVLEARVSRIAAYKSLYGQGQPLDQTTTSSVRSDSPKPSLPSLPPSTPPHLPTLTNGPIVNGTDMEVQPLSGAPRPTFPGQDLGEEEDNNEGEDQEEVVSALDSYSFLDDQEEDDSDSDDDESGGWGFVDPHRGSDDTSSSGIGIESASSDFESGDLSSGGGSQPEDTPTQEGWKADFSEQVMKYTQHKPKKTKDVTSRPSRSELQRMEQFMNQAESPASPPTQPSQDSPFGAMRMPGRRKRGPDPDSLGLAPGGVTGESLKASMLGDLAVIDIANSPLENPSSEIVKKWDDKYTMKSHFDAVTSLVFHPTEQVLVTVSEDSTLKVWNLQKASQASRNNRIVDVEPAHTFRGHVGGILCTGMSVDGSVCYSGGLDSSIRAWKLPTDTADPFDPYDPSLHTGVLHGHMDSVWDLTVQPTTGLLLSCSADGRCILWNHQNSNPLLKLFQAESRFGSPTSVDFISTDSHQMVASYSAAKAVIFDLETGQSVLNLDSSSTYNGTPDTQINKVVCHPTLPVLATAHEDKYIRFYDKNTGKVTHSMTAHPGAVSTLTFDPHGLYLLSGGHDGSLRFWSVDSKTCVQVIPAHRKRYDESVNCVACHPSQPYFASAGADGVAKVFE